MKQTKNMIAPLIVALMTLSACTDSIDESVTSSSMTETEATESVADVVQSAAEVAAIDCVNEDNIEYLCGLNNAEDILRIGDSQWLLISGMNAELTGNGLNGKLHLVNHETREFDIVFPTEDSVFDYNQAMFPSCPGPIDISDLSVHGLALQTTDTGPDQYRLYITSHGAREAIEVFEVDAFIKPTVKWVGCAPMPATSWTNSVTILADGGFYATQFMDPTGSGMAGVSAGEITGHVFEWHPGEEVSVLEGTELSGPNGITRSDDERFLYVAAFGTHEIVKFDTSVSPVTKETVSINVAPDNVRWTTDGTLYTAGGYVTEDCPGPECGIGWGVIEINPDTMQATEVGGVDETAALAGASSALLVGDEIWVGTYGGDRVGILPKP